MITSTHGELSVSEGLRLIHSRERDRVSIVGIDQWGAMAKVVALLGEHGHKSALYFAGPNEWRDAHTRLDAWRKLAASRSIDSQIVRCHTWDASEAYAHMNHLIDEYGRRGAALPTAVVAANDNQAVGIMRALHEHGLRIPQDISVVGFDDMSGVDNMYPPLTTVHPDFEGLGGRRADLPDHPARHGADSRRGACSAVLGTGSSAVNWRCYQTVMLRDTV